MRKNSFFQLAQIDDGVYLKIAPAQDNGKEVTLEELVNFLDKKKIQYLNVAFLKKILEEAKAGKTVKITDTLIVPFAGWCEYSNVEGGMKLMATLFPPMAGKPAITVEEILDDLRRMRVVFGVKEDVIRQMVSEARYFEPILIAEGAGAVDGHDAQLIYKFNTEFSGKPTINEDGTVDFHKLDLINHVKAGDVVAEIIPEDKGISGMTIMGAVIPPKKVARKIFRYGRNLQVSEDGTKLITLVTGHVTLEGDRVFVSDEYEVKTDVDTTTGDIEYEGNLHIRGNVRAGFKVKASGNITIDGVVEGAELIAGGDVILQRGIQGMNRGVIRAGGNVVATFIENATVYAGYDLEADAVLHSKVTVGRNIDIHGKNGYLIGGSARAGALISAKIIGSSMETTTVLSVGTNPEQVEKVNALKQQIVESAKDKQKMTQIVELLRKKQDAEGKLDPDKAALLQKTMKSLLVLNQQISELKENFQKESELVQEDVDAKVRVMGTIHPGVKLEFGDISMFVKDAFEYCQFVKRGADIVSMAI